MANLSDEAYAEALSAAWEFVDADRCANAKRVDQALLRLRSVLASGSDRQASLACGLTERQAELLLYIETFIGKNGYSPSFREMRSALCFNSMSETHRTVERLVERGRLRKLDHRARAIAVIAPLTLGDIAKVRAAGRGAA